MTDHLAIPEHFRAELEAALVAHSATLSDRASGPAARDWVPRRRPGSRIVLRRVAPVLALVALVVAAVLLHGSAVNLRPEPATAAGVLNASAAELEAHGGARALGPGDYFYSRIAVWWRYAGFGTHPYVVRSIQEDWLSRAGEGRSRYHVVSLSGAGVSRRLPLTRSQDMQLRRTQLRPFILSSVPEILVSYDQLRRLPTDPARLSAALDRIAARYHVNRLFPQHDIRTAIRFEMLRQLAEAPTSASLRAALYRVLARTPGLHLLGRTRDSAGRYGMGVAANVGPVDLELILDPRTGELLQTSRTLLHRSSEFADGKQPPGLVNRATYLATGIVVSTRARVH
jgi:hypothetical protein